MYRRKYSRVKRVKEKSAVTIIWTKVVKHVLKKRERER